MNIPFQAINWRAIEKTIHKGETGTFTSQTLQFGGLRLRIVEYSANYKADHWCQKGHVMYCIEGSFVTEMENGESFTLTKGMSYIVADDCSSHRSVSENGATILLVDGDFLKP